MTGLMLWKVLKYLGVSLFAAGLYGGFTQPETAQRSRSIHRTALWGFLLIWIAGYGMMKSMGYSMRMPWISTAILASLAAFLGGLGSVHRNAVRPWMAAITAGGFFLSLSVMIFRTQPRHPFLLSCLGAAALAWWWARPLAAHHNEEEKEARELTVRWFSWIARIEGLTLLILFGIYIPLKYGAKIQLDGGQGWFGWMHGIFQMVYLVGLWVTGRICQWSLGTFAVGFVASLVPFGTFLFERKYLTESATPSAKTDAS